MKDSNQVVKIEKAIADKYGTETILNPKSLWNEDKEKEYQDNINYSPAYPDINYDDTDDEVNNVLLAPFNKSKWSEDE